MYSMKAGTPSAGRELQPSLTNNSLHGHLEVPLDVATLIDNGNTVQQRHGVQQVAQV